VITASEYLGAAVAVSLAESAEDAAEFLIANDQSVDPSTRSFAERVLSKDNSAGILEQIRLHDRIRASRQSLRTYPHDPYRWIDLALFYTSAGLQERARRCVTTALALAPRDRHILRSAVRFFIHTKDLEQAYSVISRNPATPYDPWLIATEIAVAQVIDRSTDLVKLGRALASGGDFGDWDLGELRSALGTLEVRSGNTRKGKRWFTKSIVKPTENAVAQVHWAIRELNIQEIEGVDNVRAASPEANAWHEFDRQRWDSALSHGLEWTRDQPFSATPSVFGSFVAGSMLERHDEAIRICREALVPNQGHPILLNNLAFSLLNIDRKEEARKVLAMIPTTLQDESHQLTICATRGMLSYKDGSHDEGQELYDASIQGFLARRDYHLVALAAVYHLLCRAEARLPIPQSLEAQLRSAEKLMKNQEIIQLVGKLRRRVSELLESS
jgi:tetratricopeptide (TPR) repeat protein